AECLFGDRDAEFRENPLRQIDQPPEQGATTEDATLPASEPESEGFNAVQIAAELLDLLRETLAVVREARCEAEQRVAALYRERDLQRGLKAERDPARPLN